MNGRLQETTGNLNLERFVASGIKAALATRLAWGDYPPHSETTIPRPSGLPDDTSAGRPFGWRRDAQHGNRRNSRPAIVEITE